MLVRDPIVHANPLVAMVVIPHTVIEHISSLLYEASQVSARTLVLWILTHVAHQQDYMLAHYCALNGSTTVIQ